MNALQLIIKQMRQRALSTWLTIFSVLLGVALAIAVLICQREGTALFGQSSYGYDLIIGPKGSPLTLVLNAVYHIDLSQTSGNIPYSLYERLTHDPQYRHLIHEAVPIAFGDSYRGRPIVATTPAMFNIGPDGNPVDASHQFEYQPGESYAFADGTSFDADKFEAVVGSDMPRLTGLDVGSTFQATHGFPLPGEKPDIHKPVWTVVGRLKPTHTSADSVVFISLPSFYCIAEHGTGLVEQAAIREGKSLQEMENEVKAQEQEKRNAATQNGGKPDDDEAPDDFTLDPVTHKINLELPKEVWGISAIFVQVPRIKSDDGTPPSPSGSAIGTLKYVMRTGHDAQATSPAATMQEFLSTILANMITVLLLISLLVILVAAVSILVSIYNSVAARQREIAIYRALGATRRRIVTLICLEAGTVGLIGGLLGIVAGHIIGGLGSSYLRAYIGEGIRWTLISPVEFAYLGGVVLIALFAGLVPALKAYRTPVAENLVSQ